MKKFPVFLFLAVLTGPTTLTFAGWGKKVEPAACPAAIRKVIEEKSEGGHVDEVRVNEVEGKMLYRVEIERPEDHDLELYLAADGEILRTIDEVPLAELPEAVREATEERLPAEAAIDDATVEKTPEGLVYVVEIDRVAAPDLHLHFIPEGEEIERVEETDD